MVNALTVDVEEYFCYSYPNDSLSCQQWETLESRVVPHTLETLDILEQHNIRATFFILGWVAEREPLLVSEIQGRGHEVCSHGYAHELVYRQTPGQFRDDVQRSIDVIARVTGQMPVGYRAPSFSITAECPWALEVLAELGFEYDASIYPIRYRHYGIHNAPIAPFRLPNGIWEFPASVVNLAWVRVPFGGGGYLRLYPFAITRWMTHRINSSGRPAMVYVHPWEMDPRPPRRPRGMLSRFLHTVNLDKTRPRLLHLCADFQFAPVGTVLQQFEAENGEAAPMTLPASLAAVAPVRTT